MSKLFRYIIITLFCVMIDGLSSYNVKSDPDEFISVVDLIKSKGFLAETHEVETTDGYILEVHRVISKETKNVKEGTNKPAVYLQHGLLDSSSTWVINFRDQSLGFILADQGYDVWLGNVRGNEYGLKHKFLNSSQEEFWDFSWNEIAAYDFPAIINYIINTTGQESIFYVGHSQGTTMAFAHLSQNPDLNKKIKLFVALGPVATLQHVVSPIKYIADIGKTTNQEIWYTILGKKSFLPSNRIINWLADHACNQATIDNYICSNLIFAFCGPTKYLNKTRVPVYVTYLI